MNSQCKKNKNSSGCFHNTHTSSLHMSTLCGTAFFIRWEVPELPAVMLTSRTVFWDEFACLSYRHGSLARGEGWSFVKQFASDWIDNDRGAVYFSAAIIGRKTTLLLLGSLLRFRLAPQRRKWWRTSSSVPGSWTASARKSANSSVE